MRRKNLFKGWGCVADCLQHLYHLLHVTSQVPISSTSSKSSTSTSSSSTSASNLINVGEKFAHLNSLHSINHISWVPLRIKPSSSSSRVLENHQNLRYKDLSSFSGVQYFVRRNEAQLLVAAFQNPPDLLITVKWVEKINSKANSGDWFFFKKMLQLRGIVCVCECPNNIMEARQLAT